MKLYFQINHIDVEKIAQKSPSRISVYINFSDGETINIHVVCTLPGHMDYLRKEHQALTFKELV